MRTTQRLSFAVGLTFSAAAIFLLPGSSSAVDDATFRPVVEAPLPEGFPDYAPVGKVVIKEYPAYRMAKADGGNSFWTLFRHIKANDIAMTAPVEMRYGDAQADRPSAQTMAFLYRSTEQGKLGRQGRVAVVDVPPMTVVSIGVRGARTQSSVMQSRERLQSWLDENKDQYEVAGELRVLGYNSPFVPRGKNFFEVEIPVRPVAR
jgi:hypothetical protein